jgi:hypothetical protein
MPSASQLQSLRSVWAADTKLIRKFWEQPINSGAVLGLTKTSPIQISLKKFVEMNSKRRPGPLFELVIQRYFLLLPPHLRVFHPSYVQISII